jgi:hypothetical protein
MGARYYDAGTRTFLSADPLDYNAGINLYSYAAGDPVNFTDPDGRIAKGVGSGWSGGLSSSSPTSASFNMGMSLGGTVSGAVSGLWSGGSDLVMGEYSTAPATWGRTLGQLGVGLTLVGIAADIRDWSKSAADLRNGSGSWAQMAVSTVFLIPGASELGKVGKLGNGLIGITPQGGRAIGAARGVSPGIKALSEANITDNGITVLGRFQAPPGQMNYIQKATTGKYAGSSYFDLGSAWTPIEGKAANLNFLDIVGGRGDKMIFSTPKNKITAGTSLDMEVQYLQETFGYKWVNQWSMQAK